MKDIMASQCENSNLVSFKELLMANSIQVDAVTDLLIELSIITEQEFNSKLQEVQSDHLKYERAV